MDQPFPAKTSSLGQRYNTFLHALLFVLGFSLIFILGWGGAATLLGRIFGETKAVVARLGGLVIIAFGLFNLGVLKVRWLHYDTRPQWQANKRYHPVSSLLMGIVFAAGWTPCIGTTLGAILTLGFAQETSRQAMLLSGAYALGLGVPFLLIGLGMNRAVQFVRRFRSFTKHVQAASGVVLIGIGLLLVTNRLFSIAIWAQQNGFFLDLPFGSTTTPSIAIAILAGLLSFLSPCVFPLVPAYVGYLSGQTFDGAGRRGGW